MSEETVDIHIRLSKDGVLMLQSLMEWGKYTSRSGYIEEMIMSIEDIFSAYYTNYKMSGKAKSENEKSLMTKLFTYYLLSPLRRLGWVGYRDYQKSLESEKAK